MPEERKPVYEFYVAGVQHHQLHTIINEIKVNDELQLVPEPSNRFDPNAVQILFDKVMLGYVPKAKGDYSTKVSAALEHTELICKVLETNPKAKTWEQLKVGVFIK